MFRISRQRVYSTVLWLSVTVLVSLAAAFLIRPHLQSQQAVLVEARFMDDQSVLGANWAAVKAGVDWSIGHEEETMPIESPVEGEGGGGYSARADWYWRQRAYPLDSIPVAANLKTFQRAKQMQEAQAASALSVAQSWQSLGPAPVQAGLIGLYGSGERWTTEVSGRTKVIAFDPTNSNTIYIGTATGGVWKSTNGGTSWTPLTDNQASFSIFSIAIDPTNPNTLYAGTGEISGYYGTGILKSTDGGGSWSVLGQAEMAGMVVSSIVIDPSSPQTVYAATAHPLQYLGQSAPFPAVFKSTDGGATWTKLIGCTQMCYGFSDLVMSQRAGAQQTLYAAYAGGGVYQTTNGGGTWAPLSGFPDRGYSRIELGIGRVGDFDVLYAGLAARVNVNGQIKPWGILLRSGDSGASWTQLQNAPNYCSSQCEYDNIITVHPTDPNTVYIGGSFVAQADRWAGVVWKSVDGGANWADMTPGTSVAQMVHPDMHAIALDPGNANSVWVGCDGGLFSSSDGGANWTSRNSGLATLQFVNIGVHPTNSNIAFGGLQDNAKARYNSGTWTGLDTGDGGYSEIDPFDPTYWYSTRYSMQGMVVQFQRNNTPADRVTLASWVQLSNGIDVNDRMQFYVPFTLDPSTPGVIYLGTHRLYRTANRGESWTAISGDLTGGETQNSAPSITAIGVAKSDPATIYVGTSDGKVQVTHNQGNSWGDITKAPLPNRQVSDFAIDPQSSAIAYVAFNGYDTHTQGAPGHVFKTSSGGTTWTNASGNLPDVPVLSIVLDPEQSGHIYVGTDLGVFRSTDGGASWAAYNTGLPNVPVYDLEYVKYSDSDRKLWAGTYGRGMYRLDLTAGPPPATLTPNPNQTERIYLPLVLKNYTPPWVPTRTPVPGVPTATPTVPPSGPAPGAWAGSKATFNVTTDQANLWDIRIQVPVPGCSDSWVMRTDYVSISGNQFSFNVDLRENGRWSGTGAFTSKTNAAGTATFDNVYFGTSCGTWSGTVDWSAVWVGAVPTPTPSPTPQQPTATPTPASSSGIYGQVRSKGVGVEGVSLLLRQCPSSGCGSISFEASKVATLTTGANGYYNFPGIPSLPADNVYFVFYYNTTTGGNTPDDRYLWRWYEPTLSSYTAGSNVAGGDFDIGELNLLSPMTDTVTLPVTFEWSQRGISGETYSWELFDLGTGATKCYLPPSLVNQVELTEADLLGVCNGSYGTTYGWFVWAIDGGSWETNNGYGDSYYYQEITFQSGAGPSLPTVVNGDFEQGSGTGWSESSALGYGLIGSSGLPSTLSPRSGSYVAWLGGDNNETSDLSQSFAIPSGIAVYLHYYYQLRADETVCGSDVASVLVNDTVVAQGDLCTSNNTSSWQLFTVDMASYAGQNVTVHFHATTDFADFSSFFVDDVSFQSTASLMSEAVMGSTGGYLPGGVGVIRSSPPDQQGENRLMWTAR
ncbi:MAG: hypothetical protein JW850_09980 [Thermoflexales bacterium]|nr:hypothetical protein [Thermoflexales bacterium]